MFALDAQPGRFFGFKLRDANGPLPAHEGMLSLLRLAFVHDSFVSIDYRQVEGAYLADAFRIQLTRSRVDPASI